MIASTGAEAGPTKLSKAVRGLVRCPVCRAEVESSDTQIRCTDSKCAASFPIVDGIPILINESNSLFTIDDFVRRRSTFFNLGRPGKFVRLLERLTPVLGKNVVGKANYRKFGQLLLERSESPRVLVVGGSVLGQGMEALLDHPSIELVDTDVSFGPRTKLICDAHDIPFAAESFDGVVIQAVLEHVLDPYRCVAEVHRVLKMGGVIYAEVPFMQQVHAPPYDFTRFTYLGCRRLFREFELIELGACTGPGMALAWAYQNFLLSFAPRGRRLVRLFAGLTAWYLKYFDYLLVRKPRALGAAAGYYFLGEKTGKVLSDKDILEFSRA